MNKRKIVGKNIKPPKLPRHEMDQKFSDAFILDHAYYAQLALTHDDFTAQMAEHVSFDQLLFQQVCLSKTHLKKVQIMDSRFIACDFANAEWAEAALSRVELIGCHLTGWQCSEARFQDVIFKDCHGSFAQFAFATCKSVRFENCALDEANFLEVDLSGVTFVNCNLRLADLTGTKLVGVDLRDSQIEGARVGPRELNGATIDPNQAMAFVRAMGITVRPLDEV